MCYKDESQNKAALKLEEKIKDMPEFIQNYFVFLPSNKTKLSNWSYIRQLLEWLINQGIIKHDLNSITPEDLDNVTDVNVVKYLDGLKSGLYGTKNSYTTIETKKNVFGGFWSYLYEKEYVKKNIITKQVSKKYKIKEERDVTIPTDKEVEDFLCNLENIKSEIIATRNIAIVKLFMGSGLRIEELVGLDIKDLIVDNNDNPFVLIMGKGEQNEQKEVPINKLAYKYIDDYLKIRGFEKDIKQSEPLFISERGIRLAESSIRNFFKQYSNSKIHPHMLRHYAGTMLYKSSGNNLEMVREQLRHKDINTTAKYYVKNDKSATIEALNKF